MSNDQLASLIRRRKISGKPRDFIELAEALMSSKSIELCIASLTGKELSKLQAEVLVADEQLLETGLLYETKDSFKLVDNAVQILSNLKTSPLAITSANLEFQADLMPLAAIASFETQQAITEIVLDTEQRILRVVNKNAVGLPDQKLLAQQVHKSLDFARSCYSFAQRIGLIRARDSRWWLTSAAKNWLAMSIENRWLVLAQNWLANLGAPGVHELSQLVQGQPNAELRAAFAQVFPAADASVEGNLDLLANQAQWLGLSVGQQVTPALKALLEGDEAKALELVSEHLPKTQNRLIAQGDQTLVATGPLPTEVEILVRSFAELEQVSVASTYRVTDASLTFGLECGLTEMQIRDALTSLTASALPQPIDYLIKQAAQRFGRIRIRSASGLERSIVQASDVVLLSQILNDQRLRPFAFQPITANSLSSRFEPEVIYFGLRENGYLAVRVDADDKVLSPKLSISWEALDSSVEADPIVALVAELRKTDERVGQNPSDDDLLRQLQLAIKNRSTVKVHISLRDGTEQTYELKVSGLANGRLRGLDAKADAERVLPLSQINRVEF
ncbi:MAG: helicase-associated domain-containing protein [Micrococcales bacterium]